MAAASSAFTHVQQAAGRSRSAVAHCLRLHAGVVGLAALCCAVVVDLVLPLPWVVRAALMLFGAAWLLRRVRSKPVGGGLESTAALLDREAGTDNALLHSVQLRPLLESGGQGAPGWMVQAEVDRAASLLSNVPPLPTSVEKAVRAARLRAAALAGVAALSLVLFPRVWRFELPRMLLFWQDRPPFTLTDFHVRLSAAVVKPGGDVEVTVEAKGAVPSDLQLLVESGGRRQTVPMTAGDPGVWTHRINGVSEDLRLYAEGTTGRSDTVLVKVDHTPELVRAQWHLIPPAYTHRTPADQPFAMPAVEVRRGTLVTAVVHTRSACGRVELIRTVPQGRPETLQLKPDPGRVHWSGRVDASRDAVYSLQLYGRSGQNRRDAAVSAIKVLSDEAPAVELVAPNTSAMATPRMRIPIVAAAEDEGGVQNLRILMSRNGSPDTPLTAETTSDATRTTARSVLDLSQIGVKPGDVLHLQAQALDNDPTTPHLGRSSRPWIWIVGDEDYAKALKRQRTAAAMAAEYQQALAAVQNTLEAQQAAERAASSAPGEFRRAQQRAIETAGTAAQALSALLGSAGTTDLDRPLKQRVDEMRRSVEAARRQMRQAMETPNPLQKASAARRTLEETLSGSGERTQKTLSTLQDTAALHEDILRLQDLTQTQSQLARDAGTVSAGPKAGDTRTLKALAQQQSALKADLDALQQRLEEHTKSAEEGEPKLAASAKSLIAALQRNPPQNAMQRAAAGMQQGDPQTAAKSASEAERLLRGLQGAASACRTACRDALNRASQRSLGAGAGQTLAQLPREDTSPREGGGAEGTGTPAVPPAPKPGTLPGSEAAAGSQAVPVSLMVNQQAGGRSGKRQNRAMRGLSAGGAATEPGMQVERSEVKPEAAAGQRTERSRYPAEYRELVKDYFRRVSGGAE
jgi:hypothetical protein